jgi:rare lipoprotein A
MIPIGRQEPGRWRFSALLLLAGGLAACSGPAPADRPAVALLPPPSAAPSSLPPERGPQPRFAQEGLASWYGKRFHKKRTASGERYNMHDLTAAHRTLALDTLVRVTNLDNHLTVLVRVNDRGPFKRGRVIDLSAGAADALGMMQRGIAPVLIEVYDADQTQTVALSSAGRD